MFKDGQFTQRIQGLYRDFNSAKNAPVNPQQRQVLSNGNTVEQALLASPQTDSELDADAADTGFNNGFKAGQPKSGVTTKNEKTPGIVVEVVPNDLFPDDDAGVEYRIDSNGNRVNFNTR